MTTQIQDASLTTWTNELAELQARVAAIDADLLDVAAPAEAGDADAQQRRVELSSARAAAVHRANELRAAIASGELHVERQRAADADAERARWAARADELRGDQVKAARKVDRALAQLEAAWADYVSASTDRGIAVKQSGGRWTDHWRARALEQAVLAGAPQVANELRIGRLLRAHRAKLESLVQP